MGQPALAKTNHGTLAGVLHHMNACRENEVLPIVGCEVYYRHNRKVQGQKEHRYQYFHMTLLVKNAVGWKNLMQMTSEANISGYYEKPCVDRELLWKHREGLIAGLGCLRSVFCKYIEEGDSQGARAWMRDMKDAFGDDLFAELMPSSIPEQVERNLGIHSLSHDESVMEVITVDAHAPEADWVTTQDVRLMIGTNQTLKKREAKRKEGQEVFEFRDDTYYLQSREEIMENMAMHHPGISKAKVAEMCDNTLLVAAKVQPFLIGRHNKMPKVERDRPDIDILRDLVYEGLEKHGTDKKPVYIERAEEELGHIRDGGLAPYMMMVHDVVEWALSDRGLPDENGYEKPGEKEPMDVGPGRGSAAGSLVSDSIGITNMDPISYRLQFERFWNPDRKGMPDIDVDFSPEDIELIEEYTKRKFGREHVVDVIAHITFGPRAAIRKVGTALCVPHSDIEKACKSIDEDDRSPLEEIRKVNPAVNHIAETYNDEKSHYAWTHMTRIQGSIQGKSEHAAALLVTPPDEPIIDCIPLERIGGQKGKLITAWGERAGKGNQILSDHNFIKFDWLRVAELTKQTYACKLIYEETGERVVMRDLPVHRDPYAVDADVMRGFHEGLLVGIFQFSATAARLTKKVKPDNVFDLAAINALIRPGPSRNAPSFMARKHGREPITYWHSSVEPYLDYTFGLMVFQEQLIEVVHHLGGLSKAEADNFRKIASKLYRDPEFARATMHEWKDPILAGFAANGIVDEPAEEIWSNFLSFSDYSFNLAHAAGYAVLAYRDMWLKVNYPRMFYAAFMSKGLSQIKEKRVAQKESAVREARSLPEWLTPRPLSILPPDINESGVDYTVTPGGIRLGLESIKDVGKVASKEIVSKRPFTSYQQFEEAVVKQKCNRTVKAALICAGAFDRWGMRNDYTEEKIDELERELLGVSITSHYSLTAYADILENRIWSEEEFEMAADGTRVVVAGEVIGIKEHIDKNGKVMCFVDLSYKTNDWSCTFFASIYQTFKSLIHSKRPIFVIGDKSTYEGRSSITVDDAQDVESLARILREQEAAKAVESVPA